MSFFRLYFVLTLGTHILPVSIEPAFVALGPGHVAVGMNNRVWFYSCDTHDLVSEQEYSFTVESVKLNAHFAAILCEGRACVKTTKILLFPYLRPPPDLPLNLFTMIKAKRQCT